MNKNLTTKLKTIEGELCREWYNTKGERLYRRVNPKNKQYWRKGDINPVTLREFSQYASGTTKQGWQREAWKHEAPTYMRDAIYRKYTTNSNTPRTGLARINPETDDFFHHGEIGYNTTGSLKMFVGYNTICAGGKFAENWTTLDGQLTHRIQTATNNALKRKPGDITWQYMLSIWTDVCPITGLLLEFGSASGRDNSPSIDRIDNSKGYVEGNVRWISMKANMIKSKYTSKDLMQVAISFLMSDGLTDEEIIQACRSYL